MKRYAFTLIELLIVISIIAILAATVIPPFLGGETKAKVVATQANLQSLRTRVALFRAREGYYPDSLGDLLSTYYLDAGIEKPYLDKLPSELLSRKEGNNSFIDQTSSDEISGEGGWLYLIDKAEVILNIDEPLSRRWGEYVGENPSEW